MEVCEYYHLTGDTQFLVSSRMGIGGRSSQRVFDIVNHLHGSTYITGHGAQNYLDPPIVRTTWHSGGISELSAPRVSAALRSVQSACFNPWI